MTILNETVVRQTSDYIRIIVLVMGLFTIISIIFCATTELNWCRYGFIIGFPITIIISLLGVSIPNIQEPIATDYQVIFTEDIDINEFYEQYEIIEQDGKIFTIRKYYDK